LKAMSCHDVIKALKVSERVAPYVWDGQDEDERPATPEELLHGLAVSSLKPDRPLNCKEVDGKPAA
jgi:hypothetical protein